MTLLADSKRMLGRLRTGAEQEPSRTEMVTLLESVVARLQATAYGGTGRKVDLKPALYAMAELGKVRTASDIGRALSPGINPEGAASLGGNRLRQLELRGWAERGELGGWLITDDGRAEAARLAA